MTAGPLCSVQLLLFLHSNQLNVNPFHASERCGMDGGGCNCFFFCLATNAMLTSSQPIGWRRMQLLLLASTSSIFHDPRQRLDASGCHSSCAKTQLEKKLNPRDFRLHWTRCKNETYPKNSLCLHKLQASIKGIASQFMKSSINVNISSLTVTDS